MEQKILGLSAVGKKSVEVQLKQIAAANNKEVDIEALEQAIQAVSDDLASEQKQTSSLGLGVTIVFGFDELEFEKPIL